MPPPHPSRLPLPPPLLRLRHPPPPPLWFERSAALGKGRPAAGSKGSGAEKMLPLQAEIRSGEARMHLPRRSTRACPGGALEPAHLASHSCGPAPRPAGISAVRGCPWGMAGRQIRHKGLAHSAEQTSCLQECQRFLLLKNSATKELQQFCIFFTQGVPHLAPTSAAGPSQLPSPLPGFQLGSWDGRLPFPVAYLLPQL